MFEAGVPEKLVQERMGHRSVESLRLYQRTTRTQHKAVSTVLTSDKPAKFTETMEECSAQCKPDPVLKDEACSSSSGDLVPFMKQPQAPQNLSVPSFHSIQNCTMNFYFGK